MNVLIAIDDTDTSESPGSGQLSANLRRELLEKKLALSCSNITRHQLLVHRAIPYTSGNSSMCFSVITEAEGLDALINCSAAYLRKFAAPGSDPGLCVVATDDGVDRSRLMQFGCDAKGKILTKSEACQLAAQQNIHLSEHGGTGLGVIGALAGIGLRLAGNDGRFRGWLRPGAAGERVGVDALVSHPWVDEVVDDTGLSLAAGEQVELSEDRVKTVLRNHRQVVVVKRLAAGDDTGWRTCTKAEVKTF